MPFIKNSIKHCHHFTYFSGATSSVTACSSVIHVILYVWRILYLYNAPSIKTKWNYTCVICIFAYVSGGVCVCVCAFVYFCRLRVIIVCWSSVCFLYKKGAQRKCCTCGNANILNLIQTQVILDINIDCAVTLHILVVLRVVHIRYDLI